MGKTILITNDDGIHAKGLKTLRSVIEKRWDVVVVAPDREMSATGHALTLHRPLRLTRLDERTMSVDGTPVDCVLLAVMKVLEHTPDCVVSGINCGSNLGDDVFYSGTVSAAIEGTIRRIPSIAVSLCTDGPGKHLDTAAKVAEEFIDMVFREGLPEGTLLNINVPDLPLEKLRGKRPTCLGRQMYDDLIIEKVDPRGKPYYWIGGQISHWEDGIRLDYQTVQEGFVSVTPLHLDLTDHDFFEKMDSLTMFSGPVSPHQ